MATHVNTVEVEADTPEQAATVMSERLGFSEDYGFTYQVGYMGPGLNYEGMTPAERKDVARVAIRWAIEDIGTSAVREVLLSETGNQTTADARAVMGLVYTSVITVSWPNDTPTGGTDEGSTQDRDAVRLHLRR